MKNGSGETRTELQRLSTIHKLIAELFLQGRGPSVISGEVGLTAKSVSRIIQSATFQDYVARRRREQLAVSDEDASAEASAGLAAMARAKRQVEEATEGAVGTIVGIMNGEDTSDSLRLKSAEAVLNRAFKHEDTADGPAKIVIGAIHVQGLKVALAEAEAPQELPALEVEGEEVEG